MAKQRQIHEQVKKPSNIREAADRSQVLPRYMAMSTWVPHNKLADVGSASIKGNRLVY